MMVKIVAGIFRLAGNIEQQVFVFPNTSPLWKFFGKGMLLVPLYTNT